MLNNLIKKNIKQKILPILLIAIFFLIPHISKASTLSILPNFSQTSSGNIVSVRVSVNTLGKFINNSEGTINFPTDLLEVVSVNKNSSIFTLWVEDPIFSNYTGKISWNGGISTPGFNGNDGTLFSIVFRTKKEGIASIVFTGGSVRENDGLGTDILKSKNSGSIQIIKSLDVDTSKNIPSTKKEEVFSNKAPTLFVEIIDIDQINNVINFNFEKSTIDAQYYTIQIDDNPSFKITKDDLVDGKYFLPIQSEGRHSINIVAFSKNGDYAESSLIFNSPMIIPPLLSIEPKEINRGEHVVVNGKTQYPNQKVNIFLEFENGESKKYSQITSTDGSFSITTNNIKSSGVVSVWSEIEISDTIKSLFSEKIYFQVNKTPIMKITLSIIYPLMSLIIVSVFMVTLIISFYFGWHKYFGLKKKINIELTKTSKEVHKAMLLMKKELDNQLKSLEKVKIERNLNQKEEDAFNNIKKNLDSIDEFIKKKLKKIIKK